MVVHLAVLTLLAVVSISANHNGGGGSLTAVLSFSEGDSHSGKGYDESEGSTQSPAFQTSSAQSAPASLQAVLSEPAPVDPSNVLPATAVAMVGGAGFPAGGAPGAQGADRGSSGIGYGLAGQGGSGRIGGKGHTRVFGLEGEGYKFVYVFDRSGSMGGVGRSALGAAKAELLASLKNLQPTHQFQIIFYNETPTIFNPSGQPGKLAFATDQSKELARRFLGTIVAEGGTRHEDALKLAIKLQPDVIFFLTDADEPRLSAQDLAEIHRWANGIVIHSIEFGLGPKASDEETFLAKLARQNGGQYVYIDITRLLPGGVAGRP